MRIAIREGRRPGDDHRIAGMNHIARRVLAVGASVMAFGAMITAGSITEAFAHAQTGTVGSGYTYFPTASPYHSYAYVTKCHSANGSAPFYQGEAILGTSSAFGPRQAFPGPDSTVSLHKIGSYTGTWHCLNVG